MAKVRVSELAKRMGISAKDLVFKLQSLGVAVEGPSTALDPNEVIAVLSGKKVAPRPRAVIMRDEKAQVEQKKETVVRPPRPIVAPPRRAVVPTTEPQTGPITPTPIIPEFIQAAEAEEAEQARAAAEAASPREPKAAAKPKAAKAEAAETPGAPVAADDAAPEAPAPATATRRPATSRTGPTGPRAALASAPRPSYQAQQTPGRPQARTAGAAAGRPATTARPGMPPREGGPQRPAAPGDRFARPAAGAGARPMGARPGMGGVSRPGMMPPPPPLDTGLGRKKKGGEDERPEKKKATGKRGIRKATGAVDDTNLFTKGPFSATAVLDEEYAGDQQGRPMGPDAENLDEPQAPRAPSSRRDARKQASPAGKVLDFQRPTGTVSLSEGVTVKELADKLAVKASDLMKHLLMKKGMMLSINAPLGAELAMEIARELGIEAELVSFEDAVELESLERYAAATEGAEMEKRAPVITVMGHVDHGKTSLLDAIRETDVASGEAGGITQHIGAYAVEKRGQKIVFLDTPGHEAFTMMRARGAKVTDIVVLVVAADDGVMPQTREAISHAQAAGVPMIVAINKIDKPNANIDRVRQELANAGVLIEEYGGDVVSVQVSALKRQGIDDLLEMILLTSDLLDLKATPQVSARGVVLEARKETGRGIVANVLIQDGTLSIGDSFFCGAVTGRVRAMVDDHGTRLKQAGPATPISVTGFDDVPNAGDSFVVVDEEAQARMISEMRQQKMREESTKKATRMSLDQLFQQMQSGTIKELNLIVKADVQGSVEVLIDTLKKQSNEQVRINILHASVGAISTNDVLLASASNAIIVGFNVRPERSAAELAEKEGVELRLHTVIYQLTDEIRLAMTGLLDPTFSEVFQGRAEVRDTFRVPKIGLIAGCYVLEGIIPRTSSIRLLRDNRVIFEGKISSLRHFKNDVSEVRAGFECGIGIERFQDIKVGDVIEAFKIEKTASALR
jgi:translation initiation factor IF-2